MLADAFRAEAYRFVRNRTAVFWSIAFVPILGIVFSIGGNLMLRANASRLTADNAPPEVTALLAGGPIDLGAKLVERAGDLANPMILLFVLIGAATLYAGDYRWETWRLISARNTRPNLLMGKIGVVGLTALVAMVLLLIASVIGEAIKGAILGQPLGFSLSGEDGLQILTQAGLSWLRIMQVTMLALLAATVTRSLLAALLVPLVVSVSQFFSPQMLGGTGLGPDSWVAILVNPGAGVDAIRAAVKGGAAAQMLPDGLVMKGWISLILWLLWPLAAALAWFQRQDLSKE